MYVWKEKKMEGKGRKRRMMCPSGSSGRTQRGRMILAEEEVMRVRLGSRGPSGRGFLDAVCVNSVPAVVSWSWMEGEVLRRKRCVSVRP